MNDSVSFTPLSLKEFCELELGVELTDWQARILLALEQQRTIILPHPRNVQVFDIREMIDLHTRYHLEMRAAFEEQQKAMDHFAEIFGVFYVEVEKTTSIVRDIFSVMMDVVTSQKSPRHALPRKRRKDRTKRPERMAYVPKRKVLRGQRR